MNGAKSSGRDHAELHLLRTAPERLVGVVEETVHHAALAAEVDVGDVRLGLEHGAHHARQVGVELEYLLELVEDQA